MTRTGEGKGRLLILSERMSGFPEVPRGREPDAISPDLGRGAEGGKET